MKLRHFGLALAFVALSALATALFVPAAAAIPNAPSPVEPGACGYIPYMTLGSSCTGAGYIVGSSMSLSACKATQSSFVIKALSNHGCDWGDWNFECRPAKWCF